MRLILVVLAMVLSSGHNYTCKAIKEACVAPNQTQVIEGIEVTKPCFEYQVNYQCTHKNPVDECKKLRSCTQLDEVCEDELDNVCIRKSRRYTCGEPKQTNHNTRQELRCKHNIYCLDGQCDDRTYTPYTDFGKVAAHTQILKHLKDEVYRLKGKLLKVFSGQKETCQRNIFSSIDCCKRMGGWGKSLGIARCDAAEKALITKRQEGKCREIGTYCIKKAFFGGCLKKRTSFCCFESRFIRLIQEQGRVQIGKGWGWEKEPDCGGFTFDELKRIDFEKLDLTEAIQDILSKVTLPGQKSFNPQDLEKVSDNIKYHIDTYMERMQGER